MKALKITFDSFGGSETLYIPFEENLNEVNMYMDEFVTVHEAFTALKEKWESKDWTYNAKISVESLVEIYPSEESFERYMKLVESQLTIWPEIKNARPEIAVIKNENDTLKCIEFDIWCYSEFMHENNFYSRPFDVNPEGGLFSSYLAMDARKGELYSKDFAYFECCECNRTICEQNPSNGWHTQYRFLIEDSSERICLKCFEAQQFSEGSDLEEVIKNECIRGMFFNTSELKENGFSIVDGFDHVLIGAGRFGGYGSEKTFFERLKDLQPKLQGKKVLFNYEDMAIGGLGGYVSIYAKA